MRRPLRESVNRNGVTGWNGICAVSAAVALSGAGGVGAAGGATLSGAFGSTLKLQLTLPPLEPTDTL